jgi:osmotically-inducible protein OsmY
MLSLAVREGRVIVMGRVDTEKRHQEAIRLAWTVAGVQDVVDQVTVTQQGEALGDYTQDAWISTKLETQMLFDGKVASRNYKIKTTDRVVYLTGIARSQEELDRVLEIARNIKGVRRVVSYVRVKDARPANDASKLTPN